MAQLKLDDPPALFAPPLDLAHDIFALAAQLEGFSHETYQDVAQDQAVFDSFQRWPYLFGLVMGSDGE